MEVCSVEISSRLNVFCFMIVVGLQNLLSVCLFESKSSFEKGKYLHGGPPSTIIFWPSIHGLLSWKVVGAAKTKSLIRKCVL